MSDAPDAPRSGDLTVLDAWRILVKPAPTRPVKSYVGLLAIIVLLNLSAIAAIVSVLVADPSVAIVAALVHTMLVPGALLAFALVPPDEVDLVEWLALALGFGVATLVLGGLALALLPGRLIPLQVVMWTAVVTLAIAAFAFRRGMRWRLPATGCRAHWISALLVTVVAASLRLPGLGYSEFQGDETEVILRATGVVQDLPDALFYHGKGPGEIVTVALNYGLLGNLSEAAARLPFALSGVGGVLAFYLVARRLLGTPAALAAGLLMAVNGYFLAFSRITQYQSLVLLLGMLGLWCALRWSRGGASHWPVVAGVLVATAALAHYDALFFLPPIAMLALWRTGWRGLLDYDELAPWLRGAAAGAIVLGLFFLPYVDSPLFALATERIGDRVGAGFPRNNVLAIVASGTLYLGTAFPVLVGLLIACGIVGLAVGARPERRVWLLGLVWAGVPLLFYAFVARKPGTHVHVATSGLLLLACYGAATIWVGISRLGTARHSTLVTAQVASAALLAGGIALVGTYLIPIYLQSSAEIVRENKVLSLPLTWRPPGGLPAKERFGFPYQAGWKAAGVLFADSTLAGSYDSNEQPQVTYWYTRGAWRCSANPRYYLIAENVQDEIETPRRTISSEYHPIGTVRVAGEPKLRIFERGPADGARAANWAAEQLTPTFDQQVSAPTFDPGTWARGVVSRAGTRLSERFGQDIDLLGYEVYAENPRPGGVVRVDLFWLPRVSSDQQHRIDVQLGRDPRIGDGGGPACDKTGDDKTWSAGRPFTQRVSIPITAAASPGPYPLLVGVSRLRDSAGPLQASGDAGEVTGLVEIGQVEIQTADGAGR
jgi:4-amino-4-deoxy-L-arabinose transferase-like glycosyltransferase